MATLNIEKISADEDILFTCKKSCSVAVFLSSLGIFVLPAFMLVPIRKVPLEVSVICVSFVTLYIVFIFLAIKEFRNNFLVLTNRRLFLRQGLFSPKSQIIDLGRINSIHFVSAGSLSYYGIFLTDGSLIKVSSIFTWDSKEKLVDHFSDLTGKRRPSKPEKAKPLTQIIYIIIGVVMALGIYFHLKNEEKKKQQQVQIEKRQSELLQKKRSLEQRYKMLDRMEQEYQRLSQLQKHSGTNPVESIGMWKQFLINHVNDISGVTKDDELKIKILHTIIHLQGQLPAHSPLRRIKLRSVFKHNLSEKEWQSTVKSRGFYDDKINNQGDFYHQYLAVNLYGMKVICDFSTGLMWHAGGSKHVVSYQNIPRWLQRLNRKGYAGFHDWRLPTLEEAASLLQKPYQERTKKSYIDAVFSKNQSQIYSSDQVAVGRWDRSRQQQYWQVVYIWQGCCNTSDMRNESHIRPVRSMQPMPKK